MEKTRKSCCLNGKVSKLLVTAFMLIFATSVSWAQSDGTTSDTPPDEDTTNPTDTPPDPPDSPDPVPTPKPPEVIPTPAPAPAPAVVPNDEVPPEVDDDGEEDLIIAVDKYLDAPVITATRKVTRTAEAPAIISVIAADQIEDMAPETLYDVLGTVPGVEIIETYYGYTSVTFRGVLQTHYNNKSLMLVNGTPLYDTINGSFYLEQMPMSAIRQIEVIRGPGSTLYGTNAFAGVINMIPYDGTTAGKTRLTAKYGRFNTINFDMSGGFTKGPFAIYLAASQRYTDGYKFFVEADEQGRSGEPVYGTDRNAYQFNWNNIYTNVKFYDLKLSLGYFDSDKDKYGLVPALISTGNRRMRGFFSDLTYDIEVNKNLNITPKVWFNFNEKEEDIGWYPPAYAFKEAVDQAARRGGPEYQEFSGYKMGGQIGGDYSPMDILNIRAGLVFEYKVADYYRFFYNDQLWSNGLETYKPGEKDPGSTAIDEKQSTYDLSGYLEGDVRLFDMLGVVAGLRYNYNKDSGSFVAPRGGLVVSLMEGLSAKLLYGRAFRNPDFFEQQVATQGVLFGGNLEYYNPAGQLVSTPLAPEQVDTIDFGLDFKLKRHSFRLNYFWLNTADQVARNKTIPVDSIVNGVQLTAAVPQYGNDPDGYWMTGIEFDYRSSPINGMKTFFNFSWKMGRSNNDALEDKKLYYFAPILANLGISHQWLGILPWLKTSTYLQFIGPRSGPKFTKNAEGAYVMMGDQIELDPYLLWTINIAASMTKNMELALIAHNILNQKYEYPEYVRLRTATVPGGPGTSVFGRLTLKF